MSIRTFWIVLIKILGLSLLLSSLIVVPSFLSTFIYGLLGGFTEESPLFPALMLLMAVAVYLLVLWLFLFRTAWLVDKLHLDKGFQEERVDLNVKTETLLRIAAIVIGGLILVEALPELCKQLFVYVRERNMSYANPTSGWLVFQLVKSLIGYLLMAYNKPIVAWIGKSARQENE